MGWFKDAFHKAEVVVLFLDVCALSDKIIKNSTFIFQIVLRINQPIKDAAVGRVDGDGYLVGSRRVGNIKPVGAQTLCRAVGLHLQLTARVNRRPVQRQVVARDLKHDVRRMVDAA
jgi:hypothetical protein